MPILPLMAAGCVLLHKRDRYKAEASILFHNWGIVGLGLKTGVRVS